MSLAVVVGATGAIGRVVVDRLVAERHQVLAVARSQDALEELAAARDSVVACSLDVTGEAAGDVLADAVADQPVGLLAYLASAPLGGDILDTPDDVIRAAFEVKIVGLLRLVRALKGSFAHPARIVAVGGNLGFDPVPTASTAGLANAAQANLVRQLNRVLAPSGVTCHTVAPGPVDTARFRGIATAEAERRGVDVDEVVGEAGSSAPLGRLTLPEEVAWAVVRLTDPEASALAGSTLLLDGGRRTATP